MRHHDSGGALIVVLILATMFLSVIALSLQVVPIMAKLGNSHEKAGLALRTADSGLEYAKAWVKDPANSAKTLADFATVFGASGSPVAKSVPGTNGGTFSVTRSDSVSGATTTMTLISTGTYNGSTRRVRTTLTRTAGSGGSGEYLAPIGAALVITGSGSGTILSLGNSSSVVGDVILSGSLSGKPVSLSGGGPRITGKLALPAGLGAANVNGSVSTFVTGGLATTTADVPSYTMPTFPAVPSAPTRSSLTVSGGTKPPNITVDGYYPSITLQSNLTQTIDCTAGDRTIVVDSLDLRGGSLDIKGSHKLNLYVLNTFKSGSNMGINKGGASSQLSLFYKGAALWAPSQFNIAGAVWLERSSAQLTNGFALNGSLFCGGTAVELSGDMSASVQAIYAPLADITLGNSGKVTGSVVAKSISGSGSGKITYASTGAISLPVTTTAPASYSEGTWSMAS